MRAMLLFLLLVPLKRGVSFLHGISQLSYSKSPVWAVNMARRKSFKSTSPSTLLMTRQICAFDSTDFSLPTGSWPYTKADLNRVDNSDDASFYDTPRYVTHIDDRAIQSLTSFYREEMNAIVKEKKAGAFSGSDGGIDVLDLCSSWISHLPTDVPLGRVVGIGMNEQELKKNEQLTEYAVQDLNKNPDLTAYDDESFDVVCNVVSVDYLTRPLEIFKEISRVLRPHGVALISFSNRCFPTKAVAMWLQADDIGKLTIVGSYFHYSGQWRMIEALDIQPPQLETPKRPSFSEIMADPSAAFAWASTAAAVSKANNGDPMFVVKAVK